MKKPRTSAILIFVIITSSALLSCGGKDKSSDDKDKLGKMEVVIPEELKDNPEIVEYIEGMSQVVDEYALGCSS